MEDQFEKAEAKFQAIGTVVESDEEEDGRRQGEEGESLKSGCGTALLAACLVARVEENLQGDGRGCGRQGMFFCTLGVRGGCGIG